MTGFEQLPAVSVTKSLAAAPDAIWKVLSDLGALAEWAPGIDGVEVTSSESAGVGAVRAVTTAQFGVIVHRFTDWWPGEGFAYETADSGPFSRTLTAYTVEGAENGGSTVTVRLAFDVKPGAIEVEQAKAVLDKGLTATLQALDLRARMGQTA